MVTYTEQEAQIPTVHWVTYTGQYSGLTIACGLWPMMRHEHTAYEKETTCGNCKRTKGYLKRGYKS